MPIELEQVRDTVRKLLNLAESSTFEGEIENALRFAHRLMSAHHLEAADVHERAADSEEKEYADETCSSQGVKLSGWEKQLGAFVATMVGGVGCYLQGNRIVKRGKCIVYGRNGQPARRSAVHFYGLADEVELATDLYSRLSHTIATMGRLRFGGVLRGNGCSYGDGFVYGLQTQLETITQQAIEGNGHDLVVQSQQIAVRKKTAAREWLASKGIRLGSARRTYGRSHSPDAFSAGQTDGQRADGRPAARRLRIT